MKELNRDFFIQAGLKGGEKERQRWASMTPEEREQWKQRNREAGKKGGRKPKPLTTTPEVVE